MISRDDLPPTPEWVLPKPIPKPEIPPNVTVGEN